MTDRLAYVRDCQLLRAAAELLRLPQPVIATSLTFLHRFHHACPDTASASQIAPACLFLASKVEEAQVRINDLLNAFLYLEKPADPAAVAAIFPGLSAGAAAGARLALAAASPTSAAETAAAGAALDQRRSDIEAPAAGTGTAAAPQGVGTATSAQRRSPTAGGSGAADGQADRRPPDLLVGDAYYTAKDELIHHEQVLLRWLGFQICVDHPYRYLLNFANVMRCSEPVVRLSLSLVNDSLLHSNLSARRQPADVAAGALQLGALLLGTPLRRQSRDRVAASTASDAAWSRLVGLDPLEVDAAGRELLETACSHAAVAGASGGCESPH